MVSFINYTADKIQDSSKVKYFLNDNYYFVEEFAIKKYAELGYEAIWAENHYWWRVFCLLFWDIIFIELEDVDIAYDMPSDLFSPDFYRRRKRFIQNRINELENISLSDRFIKNYKLYFGKPCRLMEYQAKEHSLEELIVAVTRLNNNQITKILHRLISNINENRSGFPDLIVFNDSTLFFAEVKSEKDKLHENQIHWQDFLEKELELKVEIFCVNKTDLQIKNMKKKYGSNDVINVSFGHSSSKKLEDAISFIKTQKDFKLEGEGKNAIYSANFSLQDIESLYNILDLTSGWKSQNIMLNERIVKSTELRSNLYCYREKQKEKASLDWCNKGNKLGCRQIYEIDDLSDYGYLNSESQTWIVNKDQAEKEVMEQIERIKLCPLFDIKQVKKYLKSIPEVIDPKTDSSWGFRDNDYNTWVFRDNKWTSTWSYDEFPGINMMIGVERLSKEDKRDLSDKLKTEKEVKDISFQNERKSRDNSSVPGCLCILIFVIIILSIFS